MAFDSELTLVAVENNQWRLAQRLNYTSADGRVFSIPQGFLCDLASIPRVFRLLIPVNGRHRAAAVLHDYLYHFRGNVQGKNVTRLEADNLFLEAMETLGVSYWKRHSMYWAVRMGGFIAWNT